MIKLKDILFENEAPDIFVPRRVGDRAERLIKSYVRGGSKGDLILVDMELIELPEILKNISVGGNFQCQYNKLTNLKNSPKYVGGSFYCNNNKLTSLEGATEIIGGDFNCHNNKLTNLEGAPQSVVGYFYCSFNKLDSLKGAPLSVGRDFKCTFNNLESLEGAPQSVGGNFICNSNPVIFSKRLVKAVCKVKGKVIV